jgi:hypothetical protein
MEVNLHIFWTADLDRYFIGFIIFSFHPLGTRGTGSWVGPIGAMDVMGKEYFCPSLESNLRRLSLFVA